MILLRSSSNRIRFYLLLLAALAFSGCAFPGGGARPAARGVSGTPVRLTAQAAGPAEVAGQLFEFHLRRDGRDLGAAHTGTAPVWEWTPQEPGVYRSRTIARDPAGKVLVESDWSAPFEIAPPLEVQAPTTDRPVPQTAGTAIRWTATASGGAGEITYTFDLRAGEEEWRAVQSGPSPEWRRSPEQAGHYQVRVVAVDAHGNRAESGWSDPYEIVPPLAVKAPTAGRPAPQTVGTAIPWITQASGGVGKISYGFELRPEGGTTETEQSGPESEWLWSPEQVGRYQVRAVAVDARGNRAESEWSALYEVVQSLEIKTPAVGLPAPQTAGTAIRWITQASGGVGEISYGFELRPEGAAAATVQSGPSPDWLWSPEQDGRYQVRAVAVDIRGNRAESDWSAPYEIVPPLAVKTPTFDRPAPQTAGTAIRWTVQASGGVGEITYGFELRPEGGATATVQSGPESEWRWSPAEAGRYQVRAVAVDARGNRFESEWSDPYEVVPPLAVKTPTADRPAPQTAGTEIRWTAAASGGVGEISYGFELRDYEDNTRAVQSGPSPEWLWNPAQAGRYLVRTVAVDSRGNRAVSEWSAPYEVVPPLAVKTPEADLPAPRAAGSAIRWTAAVSGGVGKISFGFELRPEGAAAAAQPGPSPDGLWSPPQAGRYQVRAVAVDIRDNRAVSDWSTPYEIVPPLAVKTPTFDRPSPQAAGTAIRWMTQASGGVGEITYMLRLRRGEGEIVTFQSGPASEWLWSPVEAGRYLVWVVAVDAHGNRAVSELSVPYEIVPPLAVKTPAADRPAPQTAGTAIRWTAAASGGVGEISFGFELRDDEDNSRAVQSGPSPEWLWNPAQAGRYQVRVVAVDAHGNRTVSEWSAPYEVVPPLAVKPPEADLPAPRAAGSAIRWTAAASGGVGKISFGFELRPEEAAAAAQPGPSPDGLWSPPQAGRYQVRAVAVDIRGNRAVSDWSAPYEIVPPLAVKTPTLDRPSPQAAGTAIRWMTQTSGGVGEITYGFELRPEGGVAETEQSGPESEWRWSPAEAGRYQVRAVAVDAHGNRAVSEWSVPYEIVPPLAVKTPTADRPAPRMAGTAIRWTAAVSGGVGEISFGFELRDDEDNSSAVQSGPSPEWLWNPAQAGRFQVRVVAVDSRGNRAASEWSAPYEVVPPLAVKTPDVDRPAPQTVGTTIRWTVLASGGVGEIIYEFRLRRGDGEIVMLQSGPASEWLWSPVEAGRYQVWVVAADAHGNQAASEMSVIYEIVPQLEVKTPSPDRPAPQAAGTAIRWTAQASGGAGEITYAFDLRADEEEAETVQSGPSPNWLWSPAQAGRYQVRVVAVDARGNRSASGWIDPYEVVPRLAVKAPAPDRPAPQTVETAVRWQAEASGGVGSRTWSFFLQHGKEEEALLQEGVEPVWNWIPAEPGSYRIRTGVRDALGNTADSGWSNPYLIVPQSEVTSLPKPETVKQPRLIAVLPIENLSGSGGAPVRQMRQALLERLAEAGFTLLEDDRLDKFMTRHRIRHVGGIDTAAARAFLEETGTDAVLVTSLELNNETDPPKIALFSRLVSTGGKPEIIWMDGVGMAGDDSPGILDLGLIHDPPVLRDKALDVLVDSLLARFAGESARPGNGSGTFQPRILFDASFLQKGKRYTIGVLPFINMSDRNRAGEIMALHFVRQLAAMDEFIVLEPGVVREKLLTSRIIMAEGISKGDLDVISNNLGSDLMLTGKVNKYQDPNVVRGIPNVEFSVLLMEGGEKKIVWSSTSYNEGNDRVFFFDVGRISTALETAARMVRNLLARIERSAQEQMKEAPKGIDLFQQFRGLPQR